MFKLDGIEVEYVDKILFFHHSAGMTSIMLNHKDIKDYIHFLNQSINQLPNSERNYAIKDAIFYSEDCGEGYLNMFIDSGNMRLIYSIHRNYIANLTSYLKSNLNESIKEEKMEKFKSENNYKVLDGDAIDW